MMRLCSKDFIISRTFLLIMLPFYFLYAVIFFRLGEAYLLVNMGFTLFLAVGVTMIDDRYQADLMICSLPVNRKRVVYARYITSGLAFLIGVTLCMVVGLLLDLMIDTVRMNFDLVATLEGLLAYVLVLAVGVSIFYPFYFRWGLWRGFMVLSMAGILVIILVTILFHLTAQFAGLMGEFRLAGILRTPGLALIRGIVQARRGMGTFPFFLVIGICVSGLVWLSVRLSVRQYEKREF